MPDAITGRAGILSDAGGHDGRGRFFQCRLPALMAAESGCRHRDAVRGRLRRSIDAGVGGHGGSADGERGGSLPRPTGGPMKTSRRDWLMATLSTAACAFGDELQLKDYRLKSMLHVKTTNVEKAKY